MKKQERNRELNDYKVKMSQLTSSELKHRPSQSLGKPFVNENFSNRNPDMQTRQANGKEKTKIIRSKEVFHRSKDDIQTRVQELKF